MNGQNHATDKLLAGDALQDHLLQGVSRTFALTIPQLPCGLRRVVANAYLLCRIIDTIEDEPRLTLAQQRQFAQQFTGVVAGLSSPEKLSAELHPLLSAATIPAEHELIERIPDVIAITLSFNLAQRHTLHTCVRIMAAGMVEFQATQSLAGLANLAQLDRYCYFVAGVVGEMLTQLFCDYSPTVAKQREALLTLAVSFGQGLQMTNILKDIWDDKDREACWLPQDIFQQAGFDLRDLGQDHPRKGFEKGLSHLVAIAHGHLKNALAYTLLIPRHETGIREFCLLAIGMAMLTLRKINGRRDFQSGQQVKITRRSVRATVIASRLSVQNDLVLKSLFRLLGLTLPSVSLPLRRAA